MTYMHLLEAMFLYDVAEVGGKKLRIAVCLVDIPQTIRKRLVGLD
jgi:hypothetical protein